jgi:DNA polymerase I-like protein with 3'-5' exonuclease and polymerase domains
MSNQKFAALDFETFYSKDYSIQGSSTYQYVHHPEFDAYLVSIWSPEHSYVGRTDEFKDWKKFDGYTFIAHNASFDQRCFERCVELGIIPDIDVSWVCTADMCVYFQYQRNLKGSAKEILGVSMDKEVRNNMKGKTWDDMIAMDESKAVLQYALDDAKYTYQIWEKLWPLWPETERLLSHQTRTMAYRGLPVDLSKVEEGIDKLEGHLFEAKTSLPWYGEIDPDTKKEYVVYSKKAMAIECRKAGVEPPKSLAKDSEELANWIKEHGDKLTFVSAMQNYNRINMHLQRTKSVKDRLTDEGRMSYNLKYFGADATGRWSGDAGFNVQNMPRDTKYGVNIRNVVSPAKGKTLVISDLSQIEPRLTAFLAGDDDFLELVSKGMSPYEAHARQTMGWTGGKLKDEDPELYLLAKVRVLQLGYGSGWFKFAETVKAYGQTQILDSSFSRQDELRFQEFAKKYQPGKFSAYSNLSADERRQWVNAYIQVQDFRDKNPKITSSWKNLDKRLKTAANEGDDFKIEIPSGRTLNYFRCRHEPDGVTCATQKGSIRRTKMYGANLFQNSVQALARDCFGFILKNLYDGGYDVVLHVHDEVVVEVEGENAEEIKNEIQKIMMTGPEWMKDVPLSSDAIISKEYTK